MGIESGDGLRNPEREASIKSWQNVVRSAGTTPNSVVSLDDWVEIIDRETGSTRWIPVSEFLGTDPGDPGDPGDGEGYLDQEILSKEPQIFVSFDEATSSSVANRGSSSPSSFTFDPEIVFTGSSTTGQDGSLYPVFEGDGPGMVVESIPDIRSNGAITVFFLSKISDLTLDYGAVNVIRVQDSDGYPLWAVGMNTDAYLFTEQLTDNEEHFSNTQSAGLVTSSEWTPVMVVFYEDLTIPTEVYSPYFYGEYPMFESYNGLGGTITNPPSIMTIGGAEVSGADLSIAKISIFDSALDGDDFNALVSAAQSDGWFVAASEPTLSSQIQTEGAMSHWNFTGEPPFPSITPADDHDLYESGNPIVANVLEWPDGVAKAAFPTDPNASLALENATTDYSLFGTSGHISIFALIRTSDFYDGMPQTDFIIAQGSVYTLQIDNGDIIAQTHSEDDSTDPENNTWSRIQNGASKYGWVAIRAVFYRDLETPPVLSSSRGGTYSVENITDSNEYAHDPEWDNHLTVGINYAQPCYIAHLAVFDTVLSEEAFERLCNAARVDGYAIDEID